MTLVPRFQSCMQELHIPFGVENWYTANTQSIGIHVYCCLVRRKGTSLRAVHTTIAVLAHHTMYMHLKCTGVSLLAAACRESHSIKNQSLSWR